MKLEPTQLSPWRYRAVLAALLLVPTALVARAFDLQILNNGFLQGQGEARTLREIELPASRGKLLDRNGDPLAISTPVASVWVDPRFADLKHPGWKDLARVLDVPKRVVIAKAKLKKKSFVYLRRHITPELELAVRKLDLPGVGIQREYRRYYPAGETAAHLVGFTNIDDRGQEGVELALDAQLQGVPGKQRVMKDRLGHIIDVVDLIRAPQPGHDVQLTIDRRLQFIAYRELEAAVIAHKAKSGSLVLLDTRNGEVLALVNQPAYNPNNRQGVTAEVLRNRAVIDLFEPGSTVKPFAVAAALREHTFKPTSVIDTAPGRIKVGPNLIQDAHNYGQLDVGQILAKSSNVGISKIALSLPKQKLWEMFSDVGFGESTESAFPGEMAGYLPFFGEWRPIEQASLSFGYGISVTPLQLARAYSVIANGGILQPLTFVHGQTRPDLQRRVMDEDVAHDLRDMLRGVVSDDGTAARAAIAGYTVSGKTGTVKKNSPEGYTTNRYLSVFAGMAPASNPRFVMVVLLDETSDGNYYGGAVAAPVFSRVMSSALRLYNVPPDNLKDPPMRMAAVGGQT